MKKAKGRIFNKRLMAFLLSMSLLIGLLPVVFAVPGDYSGKYSFFDFRSVSNSDIVKNGWLSRQTAVYEYSAARLWKLFGVQHPVAAPNNYPRFMTYGLQFIKSSGKCYMAFKLKSDAIGKNSVNILYKAGAGGGIGNVYLLSADTAVGSIEALLTEDSLLGSVNFKDSAVDSVTDAVPTRTTNVGTAEVPASGEIMLVLEITSNNSYWVGVELNGTIPTRAALEYTSEFCGVGDTLMPTITAFAADDSALSSTAGAEVSYTSKSPSVISVDSATGKATALALGSATIEAQIKLNGATLLAEKEIHVLRMAGVSREIDFAADYSGADRNITRNGALSIADYADFATGRDWYPLNYNYQIVSKSFGLRMLTALNGYVAYRVRLPYSEGTYNVKAVFPQYQDIDYGKGMVYILPGDVADVAEAISNVAAAGSMDCYNGGVAVTATEADLGTLAMKNDALSPGDMCEYIVAFKCYALGDASKSTTTRLAITKLIFDGVDPATDMLGSVSLSASGTLVVGKSAAASVTGKSVAGRDKPLSEAQIVYESATPSVATVDASTGLITGVSEGEAEITVTVTLGEVEKKDTKTVRVINALTKSGVLQTYDFRSTGYIDIKDNAYFPAVYNAVKDYTSDRAWKYDSASVAWSIADTAAKIGPRFQPYGINVQISTGEWIAFRIKAEKQGIYKASVVHPRGSSGGAADVYILPGNTSNIASAIASATANGTVNFKDAAIDSVSPEQTPAVTDIGELEVYSDNEEYIAVFKTTQSGSLYIAGMKIDGTYVVGAEVEVGRSEFNIADEFDVGAAIIKSGEQRIPATDVTFESSAPSVVSIDAETGHAVALALGDAKITARVKYDGEIYDAEKTVSVVPIPSLSGVHAYYDFTVTAYKELKKNGYLSDMLDVISAYTEGSARAWRFFATNGSDLTQPSKGARFMTYGTYIATSLGKYTAFKMKIPTSGTYAANAIVKRGAGGGIGNVYLLPGDTAAEDIPTLLTSATLLGEVNCYDPLVSSVSDSVPNTKFRMDKVTLEAGEMIFVLQPKSSGKAGAALYFVGFELDGRQIPELALVSTDEGTLAIGDTAQAKTRVLLADRSDADMSDGTIEYTTSDPSVAEVDGATGKITARGTGTARIGVIAEVMGIAVTGETTVTVEDKTALESISLGGDITLETGAKRTLTAIGSYASGRSDTVTPEYKVNGSAVKVENGVLTATGEGTAEVTAEHGGITETITVTVTAAAPLHVEAELDNQDKESFALYTTDTITARVTDAAFAGTTATIAYASDNEAVAKVDESGKISAISLGTANITVSASDGANSAQTVVPITVKTAGANLLSENNADFESAGAKNWSFSQGYENPNTSAFIYSYISSENGNRALTLRFSQDGNSAPLSLGFTKEKPVLEENGLYELTFRIKAEVKMPEGNSIAVTAGIADTEAEFPIDVGSEWTEARVPVTVQHGAEGAPCITVTPSVTGKTGYSGKIQIDDIELRRVGFAGVSAELTGAAASTSDKPNLIIRAYTTTEGKISLRDTSAAQVTSTNEYIVKTEEYSAVEETGVGAVSAQLSMFGRNGDASLTSTVTIFGDVRTVETPFSMSGLTAILQSVEITSEKDTLAVGDTLATGLSGIMTDDSALKFSDATIQYHSSDINVLTIGADGKVTAKNEGKSTVTADVTLNGILRRATREFTVEDASPLAEVSLTGSGTVGVGRESKMTLMATTESGNAVDTGNCEVVYELVSCEPEGGVTLGADGTVRGVTLGARAEIRARLTRKGVEKESATYAVTVTEAELCDVALNFRGKNGEKARDIKIADAGWEINATKTNTRGMSFRDRGLDASAAAANVPVTSDLSIDFAVAYDGFYTVSMNGGYTSTGGVADVYVDGLYVGEYDFCHGITDSKTIVNVGETVRMRSLSLTEGVHNITFRLTKPMSGAAYGYMPIGLVTFENIRSMPTIEALVCETEKTELIIGEPTGVTAYLSMSDGTTLVPHKRMDGTEDETLKCDMSIAGAATLANGVITGATAGEATLTAVGEADGAKREKTATITVSDKTIASLDFSQTQTSLAIGETAAVTARVLLSDGTELKNTLTELTYTTDNGNATAEDGKISGVSAGSTHIAASLTLGTLTASGGFDVTVAHDTLGTVKITAEKFIMNPDENGIQITVVGYTPLGTEYAVDGASIRYESADESIVRVSESGLVTPVSLGSAAVTAIVEKDGAQLRATETFTVREGKTEPTLYTMRERENALVNASKYAWARNEAKGYENVASRFVGLEEILWNLVGTEGLPRSNTTGFRNDPVGYSCKYCKTDLREKHGLYSWIANPLARRWKIQCPECRRVFPSNDFEEFYKLGLDEQRNFDIDRAHEKNDALIANGEEGYLKNILYPEVGETLGIPVDEVQNWGVDDGFGYRTGKVAANGVPEVHTYIAYYNHYGVWYYNGSNNQGIIKRAVESLTNAYLTTGDPKYGRVGAIVLDRIADVYPGYDMTKLHKYEEYTNSFMGTDNNGMIRGQILGCIWQTGLSQVFAQAYDAFFPMYDDPYVVSFLSQKASQYKLANSKATPEEIRRNCEDGILRTIYEGCANKNIWGNFGMHQSALAYAAVAYDNMPETGEWIDWVFAPGAGGVATALHSNVFYDGHGKEGSPSYNIGWITGIKKVADALAGYDDYPTADLYGDPKFQKMLTAIYDLRTITGIENIGDNAAVSGRNTNAISPQVYVDAYLNTRKPIFAQLADYYRKNSYSGSSADFRLTIYDENPEDVGKLIDRVVENEGELKWSGSTLAQDLGYASLRSGETLGMSGGLAKRDTRRLFSMTFIGSSIGHKHADSLGLNIHAFGAELAPEMGYPEDTTSLKSVAWARNTISHNTVVVDDHQQIKNPESGKARHFDDSGNVKVVDVDSTNAYPLTEEYRRTLVTVEAGGEQTYCVDFFRIRGGDEHLYAFHAASDKTPEVKGINPLAQIGGTYAGVDAKFGDDPTAVISGSWDVLSSTYPVGYTYMDNVSRDKTPGSSFEADFEIEDFRNFLVDGRGIHLRMSMLNDFELNEVALARGYAPVKKDNAAVSGLRFVLARRSGTNLKTLFTTVFEPYRDNRFIKSEEGVAVTVVSGTPGRDDTVRAVKVTLESGREDYIVYATNNSVRYNVGGVFDFRGFVGVYSVYKGENVYTYINDGDIIADTTATASYSGRIDDYERSVSTDGIIEVSFDSDYDEEELIGRRVYIENGTLRGAVYKVESVERTGERKAKLHCGDDSFIIGFVDETDANSDYVYNFGAGDVFEIPLSKSEDNAPKFDAVAKSSVSAESVTEIRVNATSPLGLELAYSSVALPRGASFDAETATLRWKPDASQIGDNPVAIKAMDEYGREAIVEFLIKVLGSTKGTGDSGGGGGGSGGGETPTEPTTPIEPTTPTEPTEPTTPVQNGFSDLGGYDWARDAIESLATDGIIKGMSEKIFAPSANITRADFAILLVRAFKLTSDNTDNFSDVLPSDYFAGELAIAKNAGIIGGIGDNKYAPRNKITREDMMVIVYRALTKLGYTLSDSEDITRFADTGEISDYALDAVAALITNNLITGANGRLNPKLTTTRAEVAVLLRRILELKKQI